MASAHDVPDGAAWWRALVAAGLLALCAGSRPCAAAPRVAVLGAGPRDALVAAAGELGIGVERSHPDPGTCDALLLCAGGYPEVAPLPPEATGAMDAFLAAGRAVYVEYAPLSGLLGDRPRSAGYERLVVAGAGRPVEGLDPLALLEEHASRYLPITAPPTDVLLRYGRAAGVDRALLGVPSDAVPALVEVPRGRGRLLLSATALSNAARGQYRPARSWQTLARSLLLSLLPADEAARVRARFIDAEAWTEPRVWAAPGESLRLHVRTAPGDRVSAAGPKGAIAVAQDGADALVSRSLALPLGRHVLRVAVRRGEARRELAVPIEIVRREARWREALRRNLRWFERAGMLVAPDGSGGVREGLTSAVSPDGTPTVAGGLRVDCVSECGLMFLLYGQMAKDRKWAGTGRKMLAYAGRAFQVTSKGSWYFGHWQSRGEFAEDEHPVYVFPDDSGAATLFSLLGYCATGDRSLLRAGLRGVEYFCHTASEETGLWGGMPHRNYEGSGPLGVPWPALRAQKVRDGAPHVMNLPQASLLVAYRLTGQERYLRIAERGLRTQMAAYPRWPIVTSRTCEHARMLLPLALLQMVGPTPEHRKWLDTVAAYLLAKQAPCGALQEWDGSCPTSNAQFGTGENSILQENGDPISDQLYDTGFAVLHLWLASQVTGDRRLRRTFERLADYACRIQMRSDHSLYDGTWLRAFDYRRWEYFGSSADVGWGPYCSETGWMCTPLDLGLTLALSGKPLLPARPDPTLRAAAEDARRELDAVEAALSAPPPEGLAGLRGLASRGPYATLAWDAPAGRPLLFTLYRSTGPGFQPGPETVAGRTHATRWSDKGLAPDTDYYYRVAATNGLGRSGAPGPEIHVRTGPPSKALGRPYTKSLTPYPGYPDNGDRESTDGIYAGAYGDGKSYGYRLERAGDRVALAVTVDLGSDMEIGRASHQNCGAPGYRPDEMIVSISRDGKSWARSGSTTEETDGFLVVEFPVARARYVRFGFTKQRRGAADDWLFVGELEAF